MLFVFFFINIGENVENTDRKSKKKHFPCCQDSKNFNSSFRLKTAVEFEPSFSLSNPLTDPPTIECQDATVEFTSNFADKSVNFTCYVDDSLLQCTENSKIQAQTLTISPRECPDLICHMLTYQQFNIMHRF